MPKLDTNVRVCKKLFLNTLNVSDYCVIKWKNDFSKEDGGGAISTVPIDEKTDELKDLSPQTKKQRSMFKTRQNALLKFFSLLPKVESHYCRANSTKLYLKPMWVSKTELYREYSRWCKEEEKVEPLSDTIFLYEFNDQNLSVYQPKKDLCDVCVGHKTGNISEVKYNKHIRSKEKARLEKDKDTTEKEFVFTVDLEAVLLAPKSNVSSMYYKKKN